MSAPQSDIYFGVASAMKRAKGLRETGLSLPEIERKLRSEADTLMASKSGRANGFIIVAEGLHRITHNLITVEVG